MNSFTKFAIENFLISNKGIVPEAPNATFVSFEPDNPAGTKLASGFNSEIQSGFINYKVNDGTIQSTTNGEKKDVLKKSPNLFFKRLRHLSYFPLLNTTTFINESHFYTKVLPHLATVSQQFGMQPIERLFPKFYACHLSQNQNVDISESISDDECVIVLENLKPRGYKSCTTFTFLDYDHLSLIMYKLGQFHAYSYAAKAQSPDEVCQFLITADSFVRLAVSLIGYGKGEPYIREISLRGLKGLSKMHPELVQRMEEKCSTAYQQFMETLMRNHWDNPWSVLCHGDYAVGNLMFVYDSMGKPIDMKIIDMAHCHLSSPATDILNILCLHTDQQMRDEHWDDLLQEYANGLGSPFLDGVPEGIRLPTLDQIVDQFKGEAMYAYLTACKTLGFAMAVENQWSMTEYIPARCHSFSTVRTWSDEEFMKFAVNVGGDLGTNVVGQLLYDLIKRGFI